MSGVSTWTQLIAGAGDSVTAISAWENGTENLLGVAARDSDTLLEQSSTGWSDGRAIVAPETVTGDVTAITALSRHLVAVANPDDVTATLDNIQLLIGTQDNGLLGVVEMSTLTEKSGVFAASKVGDVTIQPFWMWFDLMIYPK